MVPRGYSTALAMLGIALASVTTSGQSTRQWPAETAPVFTSNRTLQASLERIATGSALWREAVEAVRRTGRHALVMTSEQVVVANAGNDRSTDPFDADLLAEVAPVRRGDSRVDAVVVVVNLARIEEIYRSRFSPPSEFHADLDRILVHEVYGHALPYLLTGDLSGRCPDPQPNQRVSEACSIRRENAVRAELGLGRRTDYGLDGLALARPGSR